MRARKSAIRWDWSTYPAPAAASDHDGRAWLITPRTRAIRAKCFGETPTSCRKIRRRYPSLTPSRVAVWPTVRDAGLDEAVVSVAIRGAELIRDGAEKTLTDDVERVLGRPAGTFREWAKRHRDAFE